MHGYRTPGLFVFLVVTLCYALKATPLYAQFQPPDNVTLTMYRLNGTGAIAVDATGRSTLCTRGDTSYGCTADSTDPYPFNSSTITIGIDGTQGVDNAQYLYPYLWDVTPHELDITAGSQSNKPLSAVQAQAIAARTYIYHRITYSGQYGTPNNSNKFQVFLPYRYASLTNAQKDRVRDGTAMRHYMSESNSSYPIEALYGADNPAQTITGTPTLIGPINYLRSVEDPISARYGSVDGNGIGLSSKGASRWSFGHTSSRGPVSQTHPYYPADSQGNGSFWGVQWQRAEQILTHYYTGVQIRDANASNAISTPNYRWVPLKLRLGIDHSSDTTICARNYTFSVWLQNSGAVEWAANSLSFVVLNNQQLLATTTISTAVAAGGTYTATLSVDLSSTTNYYTRRN